MSNKYSRRDFLITARDIGLGALVAGATLPFWPSTAQAATGVPCDKVCEGVSKDPAILAKALEEQRFHLLTFAEDNAFNEPFIGVKNGQELNLNELLNIKLRSGEQAVFTSPGYDSLNQVIGDGILSVDEQDKLFADGYHRFPLLIQTPRDATTGWVALDTVAYSNILRDKNSDLLEKLANQDCNREYDLRTEDRKKLNKAMGDWMKNINKDKIEDAVTEYVVDKSGKRYIAFSVRVFGDLNTKQEDLPTRARQQVGWNTDDKQFGGKGKNALPIETWYDARMPNGERILDTMAMMKIMDKSGNQWYVMDHGDYKSIEKSKIQGDPNALNNSLLANHWTGIRNAKMYMLVKTLYPDGFVPKAFWKGDHEDFLSWIQYDDGTPRYPGQWENGQPINPGKLNPGYNCALTMGHEKIPAVLKANRTGNGGFFSNAANTTIQRNYDTYTFK